MAHIRYNLHRVFFSRKKAESYLKLVQSGCDVRSMFSSSSYELKAEPEKWLTDLYQIPIIKPSSVIKLNSF